MVKSVCRGNDRSTRGGGVLLAVRDDIPSKLLVYSTDSEAIAVEINTCDYVCSVAQL